MGEEVDIVWKSFLLRPQPSDRSRDEFVAYTESWRRPAAMEPEATFRVWASDDDPPSHSMPPHVAAKIVAAIDGDDGEVERRFHRKLLHAYFAENRTVSDLEVLASIAEGSGVDRARFWSELDIGRDDAAHAVIDEHNEAVQLGIHAVPSVLVGDSLAIPGAQDVDTYVRIVEKVRERDGVTG